MPKCLGAEVSWYGSVLGPKCPVTHLLEGLWSYGGFKLRGSGTLDTPKFSAPPSGETMRQTPTVLEVQERGRGPLSPCQVWWGSDFTRYRGGKNVEFLSVCLSVRHTFERQIMRARFRHEGIAVQKRF